MMYKNKTLMSTLYSTTFNEDVKFCDLQERGLETSCEGDGVFGVGIEIKKPTQ